MTGLRTKLMIAKTVSNRNARFALCPLLPQVLELFLQSGFDTIIEIHHSKDSALASLDG